VACALAVGGVIVALIVTTHEGGARTQTTGMWAPITVVRPNVPIIAGGIPVDIDPMVHRTDFSQTVAPLTGTHRYQLTIWNTSNLGAINSFEWYPPTGVQIVKVIDSTSGRCTRTGLTGFGGNLFPTLVLYPNIRCDKLDLKAPSCTCLGNGGSVTISFVTDKDIGGAEGEIRMRAATLVFDRIPSFLKPASTATSSG